MKRSKISKQVYLRNGSSLGCYSYHWLFVLHLFRVNQIILKLHTDSILVGSIPSSQLHEKKGLAEPLNGWVS
jgi:hypothetical protein